MYIEASALKRRFPQEIVALKDIKKGYV